MNKSDNRDALLAEYNAIQQRLINISNAQNTLFVFIITAVGATLSFSMQQDNPFIALVSYGLLISVRLRVMWHRNIYHKELTYSRFVVEPLLELNIANKVFDEDTTGISQLQYYIYTLLGAGVLLSFSLFNTDTFTACVLGIILLIPVFSLDHYYLRSSRLNYNELKSLWEAIQENNAG